MMYGIVWQMNVEPQNFPTSPSRQILAQLSLFCSSNKAAMPFSRDQVNRSLSRDHSHTVYDNLSGSQAWKLEAAT